MKAPNILSSTRDEREQFILRQFECKADCDNCGNCALLHNRNELSVYADYINGTRTYEEITLELRY